MIPTVNSLYSDTSTDVVEEIRNLVVGTLFRLEHIVSRGAASPPGFWYDQEQDEWVALLKGTAELQFEAGSILLGEGDALLIPAHLKHRVAATSADAVWLALHFSKETTGSSSL